jgi:hypothetical protein
MSSLRRSRGCVLRLVPAVGFSRCAVVAIALTLAGCATDEEYRREAHARAAYAHAQAQASAAPRREADLEDDGLPSQVPPPVGRRMEPDDPREPFSRNYGRPVAAPQPEPQPLPQRAAAAVPDQPQGLNRRTVTY